MSSLAIRSNSRSVDRGFIVGLASDAEALYDQAGRAAAHNLVFAEIEYSALAETVKSDCELTRRKSLALMFFLGDVRAQEDLIRALRDDTSSIVRHEAAYYLAMLKCTDATNALVHALESDSSYLVRHEAAEALGDIGASTAIAALRRARNDQDQEVAQTARLALEQLSP